jgi:hypothetical protein
MLKRQPSSDVKFDVSHSITQASWSLVDQINEDPHKTIDQVVEYMAKTKYHTDAAPKVFRLYKMWWEGVSKESLKLPDDAEFNLKCLKLFSWENVSWVEPEMRDHRVKIGDLKWVMDPWKYIGNSRKSTRPNGGKMSDVLHVLIPRLGRGEPDSSANLSIAERAVIKEYHAMLGRAWWNDLLSLHGEMSPQYLSCLTNPIRDVQVEVDAHKPTEMASQEWFKLILSSVVDGVWSEMEATHACTSAQAALEALTVIKETLDAVGRPELDAWLKKNKHCVMLGQKLPDRWLSAWGFEGNAEDLERRLGELECVIAWADVMKMATQAIKIRDKSQSARVMDFDEYQMKLENVVQACEVVAMRRTVQNILGEKKERDGPTSKVL